MLLSRLLFALSLLSFNFFSFSLGVYAEPSSDELQDIFKFRTALYKQNDGDRLAGNPHIDETASIYEGILFLRKKVHTNHALEGKLTGVTVTAASWDDARLRAEAVSGATTDDHGRINGEFGWRYKSNEGMSSSVKLSYGSEYTYRTTALNLGLGQVFNEGSTAINLSYSSYFDTIRVIRFDGSEDPEDERDTHTFALSLVQTLNPKSLLNLSFSHTNQNGFLATSFNAVKINDGFIAEQVPNSRRRDALSARYKYAFERDSMQLGYGYYWDDWGINANVLEARYFAHLPKLKLRLEPNYRYYTQTQADFFDFEFSEPRTLLASDSDLGEFYGHSVGLLLALARPSLITSQLATYELGFNYYDRSDGLDFYWTTLGWSLPL